MAETTSSHHALLTVAVQDLHAGEQLWVQRLPDLRDKAGATLRRFIEAECKRAATQAKELEAIATELGADIQGPPNLWLDGILDDATRDSDTIEAGTLRDIALIGAFRKGKQAERVSYETAVALGNYLYLLDMARSLTQIRDAEGEADADLYIQLMQLLNHPAR